MEMDPLKVPAFMRKKTIRKQKISNIYKASKPVKTVKPMKIRLPKRLRNTIIPSLPADPTPVKSTMQETDLVLVGVVTHYLAKIKVAIIKLGMDVEVGEKLQLVGENGSFKQKIQSMQIDRKNVEQASRGEEIGMKVNKKVEIGELVYVVS